MLARFDLELPNDIIKQLQGLEGDVEDMCGDMVKAGAKAVLQNIKEQVPKSWYSSDIMHCLKITKVYKTPSDGGINCKIAFYGYFYNRNDVRTPAPLVCNVTEYGRSDNRYPKKPFMRKAFKKKNVWREMTEVEKAYAKRNGLDENALIYISR